MSCLRVRPFARHCASLMFVAALLLSMSVALFMSPASANAAGRGASIYIKVAVTETNTTVGQRPKIVLTFGNDGTVPFTDFYGSCYDTKGKLEFVDLNFVDHELIPGQNDNASFTTVARSAGTTNIYCDINAFYSNKSGEHKLYKQSNTVKVVIKKS